MAATFEYMQDTGTAAGSPTKGTTRTAARTDNNWKNIDDSTTPYSSSPVVAGNNSFDVWQFGHYTGTYNQILNGLWAHTATAFGTGLTLKGIVTATYTTPSTTANATLTTNMTSAIAIGSGAAVQFGATGPEATGKAASTAVNPAYSQFLVTQLQTTVSAAPGDSASVTLTLQYDENVWFLLIGLGSLIHYAANHLGMLLGTPGILT
jgi:hypothetical protein